MRVLRVRHEGRDTWAVPEGDALVPLSRAPWEAKGNVERSGPPFPRRGAHILPPAVPTKILGIGRNYAAHAKELGNEVPREPLVFLKAPSALVPHGGIVVLPRASARVDYEGELALVIGRRARHVPKDAWREVVAGVTCAVDVSARDLQKCDGQWWRAKGFDTFCPLGPALETDVDPKDLLLETLVDGAVKQSARTSEMIFDVGAVVAWISSAMTLEPLDVILTGTPEGVGPLSAGQNVEVRIERVGALAVTVEAEAAEDPSKS